MHHNSLIHKDVKPQNILWSDSKGDYVLCDFGLSSYIKEKIGEKSDTKVEGSPRYMSPEMRRAL
jgi:serine/threonine protein kinase